MEYRDFRELAIKSAEIYYDYLVETNKGLSISPVTKVLIKGEKVYLYVQGRLSSHGLDTIKLQVYNVQRNLRQRDLLPR